MLAKVAPDDCPCIILVDVVHWHACLSQDVLLLQSSFDWAAWVLLDKWISLDHILQILSLVNHYKNNKSY